MLKNAMKLSSHDITVLEDILLYKFDSNYDFGTFQDEVVSEIQSGCYPDSLKLAATKLTPVFKKNVHDFFTYHHEPDKYSDKKPESRTIKIDSIARTVLAKTCQICDKSFEVEYVSDPRVICPECKNKLRELLGVE